MWRRSTAQGAQVTLRQPGTNGLEELRDAQVTGANGRQSFTVEIHEARCFLVVVQVEIAGSSGFRSDQVAGAPAL